MDGLGIQLQEMGQGSKHQLPASSKQTANKLNSISSTPFKPTQGAADSDFLCLIEELNAIVELTGYWGLTLPPLLTIMGFPNPPVAGLMGAFISCQVQEAEAAGQLICTEERKEERQ